MGPGLARAIEKTTNLKIIFLQDIIMLIENTLVTTLKFGTDYVKNMSYFH